MKKQSFNHEAFPVIYSFGDSRSTKIVKMMRLGSISAMVVVFRLGTHFFKMTFSRAKIDIKLRETAGNLPFSAFLTTSNFWLVQSTPKYHKDIEISFSL